MVIHSSSISEHSPSQLDQGINRSRIALVTCGLLPDLENDDARGLAALRQLGMEVATPVWNDPAVQWDAFDLVIPRYIYAPSEYRDDFIKWTESIPQLSCPAPMLRWSIDKWYLDDLVGIGLSVVPTNFIEPESHASIPQYGEFVVKPLIGTQGKDIARYNAAVPSQRETAAAHIQRLQHEGKTVITQPYATGIDTYGETHLIYFNGQFSHAVRQRARLEWVNTGQAKELAPSKIVKRNPLSAEISLGDAVIKAFSQILPGAAGPPLSVRIELIPNNDGLPMVTGLQIIDTSLYFGYASESTELFSRSVVDQLSAEKKDS